MLFKPAAKAPIRAPAAKLAVETREHRVAGRTLPLTVTRNPRAKRLTLRIDRGGQGLRVTVPPRTPARDVEIFLRRHADWLEERLARLPDRPRLADGVRLPVRGVPVLLRHVGGRGGATLSQDGEGAVLLVHGEAASLPRRVADYLKREAKAEITALVARHAATVGREAQAIRFKDTASRWGSCTAAGTLSFSWRIMMAPPAVIDYLVAHEVAHLKEMNHSPAFWALCRKLCPDTDRCRAWLKQNGPALQAIPFG